MKKPLTKEDKRKLWTDTKAYHVTAVLDKAASDRLLKPLPTRFELRGRDGERLTLTTPPRPAAGIGQPATEDGRGEIRSSKEAGLMRTAVEPPEVAASQRIEGDALRLSSDECAGLAERLWVSVEGIDALDAAWEAEIGHRRQEVDSGAVQCRPWDEVMAELRAKHQR